VTLDAADPLERLATLIEEARRRGAPEPEAMALGTATRDGAPSVRVVLCRGVDARGVRFFTNYDSRKGAELEANTRAATTFFWPVLDVQVRLEGVVERLPAAESDAYFAGRPRGHQLSAWVSAQSRPIAGVEDLRTRARQLTQQYAGRDVPRPAYWGGYLLRPGSIEFWTRGQDRLHERVRFERDGTSWRTTCLSP
jgi:pyridoxamine 5'-phosphate oxidase